MQNSLTVNVLAENNLCMINDAVFVSISGQSVIPGPCIFSPADCKRRDLMPKTPQTHKLAANKKQKKVIHSLLSSVSPWSMHLSTVGCQRPGPRARVYPGAQKCALIITGGYWNLCCFEQANVTVIVRFDADRDSHMGKTGDFDSSQTKKKAWYHDCRQHHRLSAKGNNSCVVLPLT